MTKTVAELKAEMQSTDPQDNQDNILDTISALGTLAIHSLSDAAVNITEDKFAFSDESASGDPTKGEDLAHLIAAMVGTGLAQNSSTKALELAPAAKACAIQLSDLRLQAAWKDALPDAPNATALGVADAAGSLLTGTQTNGGATASASEVAAFLFVLPQEYVAGEAITVRVRAKVSATRTVSQTVDVVAKKVGDTLGSDICTTAAQSLTTSYANYDFTVTPTSLVAGDVLWVEVYLATDDTGGSSNGTPTASAISVRPVCYA